MVSIGNDWDAILADEFKKPYYLAEQIIPYLYEICADTAKISNVLILFSGDTGFYSGSRKLYMAIKM